MAVNKAKDSVAAKTELPATLSDLTVSSATEFRQSFVVVSEQQVWPVLDHGLISNNLNSGRAPPTSVLPDLAAMSVVDRQFS